MDGKQIAVGLVALVVLAIVGSVVGATLGVFLPVLSPGLTGDVLAVLAVIGGAVFLSG